MEIVHLNEDAYIYNKLKIMNTVLQLSTSEIEMIQEVSIIFKKYKNKTRKFDLQLSHSHFPLQQDEILYETHDQEKRVLTIVPKLKEEFTGPALATAWRIHDGEIRVEMYCCEGGGGHGGGGGGTKDN